jgi:hypothetical protein
MAILEYLFTIVLISGVMWALHEFNMNRDFGLKKSHFSLSLHILQPKLHNLQIHPTFLICTDNDVFGIATFRKSFF